LVAALAAIAVPALPAGASTTPAPLRPEVHARAVADAVVQAAGVGGSAAGTVSAVVSIASPAGSDAAIARLAAAPATVSRATRIATLARLAPAASSGARVVTWARQHGLTVTRSDAWDVTVSGPVGAMSTAFGTALVAAPSPYAPHGPASYLRPVTPPVVPAALRTVARSVVGLDTRPLYRPSATPAFTLGDFGFTGDQLRDAFGAPRDPSAGAGITVATVQFSGFHTSDFVDYANAADIPLYSGQLTTVPVDGANPGLPVGNADEEVVLDTEAILSVAPMARQRVYFAPNSLSGSIDAFAAMAADAAAGKIQVVSSSWGHCESGVSLGFEADPVRAKIQLMVAAGATMSASSGDSGTDDCGNSTTAVDFPTSVPEVVSVGGTSLTNGYDTGWSGSGGGASALYARPSYQPPGLGIPGAHRQVPDVAMLADPNTGFAVRYQGGFGTVGGTSLASPLFAGLLAGALSEAGRTTGVGDIHAALYAAGADSFQDVLTGNNGDAAGVGYDNVTGLGAPRWGALAAALGIPAVARGAYHAIDPTRIADTRTGVGVPQARLAAGHTLTLAIPGSAPGVPSSGVTAAVLNVTAVNPSQGTYLSVYPTGAVGGSATSSVNAAQASVTPNLVTVKTSSSGSITVYNSAGNVDVLVDLEGYYASDSGDLYTALPPARVLDTRNGTGTVAGQVGPDGTVDLHVAGAAGVPSSGVDAVVLNVTAANATANTFASVFPTGFAGGSSTSSLNVVTHTAVANLVITKVSSSGDVTLFNAAGSVDLLADVEGYYSAGGALSLVPVPPVRVLDTRSGAPLGPGAAGTGRFSVAANESRPGAVILNLTGDAPTASTYLSLFPANVSIAVGRTSSTLNLNAHSVRANLAQVAVVPTGAPVEQVYNSVGSIHVLADIGGYFSAQPVRLPQTTVTLSGPATAASGTGFALTANASAGGPAVATLAPGARVVFVDTSGAGTLGSGIIGADGSATLSVSGLSVGPHTVYAVVAGIDGIEGSTSAPFTVTIT
jgi:hypothetical protein